MRCMLALAICFTVQNECYCEPDEFRQETAKVMYANPKYLRLLKVITFRHTRTSPYLTSANASIVQPWENNITFVVDCYGGTTEIFSLDFKLCEVFKMPWFRDWLKNFSDVPLHCPVSVGDYHFKEIEMPPKNFPVPLPPGDYAIALHFYAGKTKEKVAHLKMNLRFQSKKKKIGK